MENPGRQPRFEYQEDHPGDVLDRRGALPADPHVERGDQRVQRRGHAEDALEG